MMKIAFVSQPMDGFSIPPQGSLTVWTYEVTRRLAQSCQVVVYARARGLRKKVECVDEVICRRIPVVIDLLWLRLFKRFSGFRSVKHPLFASNLYYLGYALQVARDLKKLQCDVVHVLNFSQFVPIIRAFNPKTKIVLNMRLRTFSFADDITRNVGLLNGTFMKFISFVFRGEKRVFPL